MRENQHIGKQSIKFKNAVSIINTASIVGKTEGEGPLAKEFDKVFTDEYFGEDSWERAESKMQELCAKEVLKKANLKERDINYILAGDLINQCIGANYAMRNFKNSFFGLYGACSTMSESLSLGAVLVSGGFADKVMCMTSSHFCTAEKQFRFPLDYGGVKAPTSQRTVTGSGSVILSSDGGSPYITHITTGRVVDKGINDTNNMGAAMAPAAADTLIAHFEDTGFSPSDYDVILTGDLGVVGSDILCDLMNQNGYDIYKNHKDAGKMIFDIKNQGVNSGASGCGCIASVFCSHFYKELKEKKINKMLVMATGALMNTMIVQQGDTIPSIAHAVTIENDFR